MRSGHKRSGSRLQVRELRGQVRGRNGHLSHFNQLDHVTLMPRFKVGVQIHPQQTTMRDVRAAWRRADALPIDTLFTWDHFFPLYGDAEGPHFEAMTLLAAMAVETSHVKFGALVTANGYRNPNLVADIARTIDHLGDGRFIFGIGAGSYERDHLEYGFRFGSAMERLRALEHNLPIIKERFQQLNPAPLGPMPILIGGGGERVTLRIVAQHADMWNTYGPPDAYARKCQVLRTWCDRVGRNYDDIERTVSIHLDEIDNCNAYLDAGAQHLILELAHPFDLGGVERLLRAAA